MVPANLTGSSIAVGVIVPVLPTSTSISNNLVFFLSAGNLKAVAHLGLLAVKPRASLWAMESTLITMPSIS